jgi:phosphatidylserine decarboxylase
MTAPSPASGADTPSRAGAGIKRLASKPLKLAASTFRPLRSSSSSSTAATPAQASSSEDVDGSVPPPSARKGLRHGRIRHLRSKGVVPSSPAQLAAAARGPRKPLDGEEPAAWLRVRVVKADDLVAKDRNGTSDP